MTQPVVYSDTFTYSQAPPYEYNSQNPPPYNPQSWQQPIQAVQITNYRYRKDTLSKQALVITTLVIVLICVITAYFCFSRGLNMLDTAQSSFQEFGGGTLAYMGLAFTGIGAVNFIYAALKWNGYKANKSNGEDFTYTREERNKQILLSTIGIVAWIPIAAYYALCGRR